MTSGSGPNAIAIDPESGADRIFTADDATLSGYTYTSAGVVSPPTSVSTSPGGFFGPPDAIVVDAKGENVYAAFQADMIVQPMVLKGGVLQTLDPSTQQYSGGAAGPSGLVLHPDGKYLYAANADGSLQVFSVSGQTLNAGNQYTASTAANACTLGIAINAAGTLLACTNSDSSNSVTAFEVTSSGADLKQVGKPYSINNAQPNGIIFHPDGSIVYVADPGTNQVSALGISTSGLSPLAGSPYDVAPADQGPSFLTIR